MKTAKCRSCDALIVWALSPRNTKMPVNAYPVAIANVPARAVRYTLHEFDDPFVMPTVAVAASEEAAVYISHFTTCPNASSHSKKATTP